MILQTYIFYHTGAMENGSGYRRSVCVDELVCEVGLSECPHDEVLDSDEF